jgi:hypothetical protein
MTTGDSNDTLARLKAVLPSSWFRNSHVDIDALMSGIGVNESAIYAMQQYAKLQTRVSTATGGWLDLIAQDFFDSRFLRRLNETDTSFAARIKQELIRSRQTRSAILQMLLDLTGQKATLQEPWNPLDWGGYGLPYSGYGIAMGYGSLQLRNQMFITAVRPNGGGIPNVAGYGTVASGYGAGNGRGEYADISQVTSPVPDSEIYARIQQTIAAGTTAWVTIVSSGQNTGSMVLIGTQSAAMGVLQDYWY